MRGPALLLACLIGAAIVAPIIAPYPPDQLDLAHRREPPSIAHVFGTDDLGRDVLARVLFGARVSLAVGLLSAAVAGASGIVIGGAAGYAGGTIDALLMRGTDAMLAVARGILLESALSFFGVGVRPPQASWGNMLYQAQSTLATEPWLAFAPGLFILMTTLSVNLAGDRLASRRL